jgi:hypothetical protein
MEPFCRREFEKVDGSAKAVPVAMLIMCKPFRCTISQNVECCFPQSSSGRPAERAAKTLGSIPERAGHAAAAKKHRYTHARRLIAWTIGIGRIVQAWILGSAQFASLLLRPRMTKVEVRVRR